MSTDLELVPHTVHMEELALVIDKIDPKLTPLVKQLIKELIEILSDMEPFEDNNERGKQRMLHTCALHAILYFYLDPLLGYTPDKDMQKEFIECMQHVVSPAATFTCVVNTAMKERENNNGEEDASGFGSVH